jgi:hypothetical protein
MAVDTKRLQVGKAKELLSDVRNAGEAFFEKNVFVYAHRYVVTTDYTAGNQLTIEFDGALEILHCQIMEGLTATVGNINFAAPADISGRVGKTITTAATNASSLFVTVFAIVRV